MQQALSHWAGVTAPEGVACGPHAPAVCRPTSHMAVCVSGQQRTLHHVAPYLAVRVLQPIRNETDVFVVVDPSIASPAGRACAHVPLQPCVKHHIRSRTMMHGLAECERLISDRERARRRSYSWIVRVRPDFLPQLALPAYEHWPIITADVPTVYASDVRTIYASDGDEGGCFVGDQFLIMSRTAARIFHAWASGLDSARGLDVHPEHSLGLTFVRARVRLFRVNNPHYLVRMQTNNSEDRQGGKGGPLRNFELTPENTPGHALPSALEAKGVLSFHTAAVPFQYAGPRLCFERQTSPMYRPEGYSCTGPQAPCRPLVR